jgi:glucose/mannose-6-phosphate isomerase
MRQTVPDLDDLSVYPALDPHGMLGSIVELPDQCDAAWRLAMDLSLPRRYGSARGVLIVGVGGSAIGADLVRSVVLGECRVPVAVHRGYELPGYVDRHTLVIVCSYSGYTEEALVGLQCALERKCPVLAVTTGGNLGSRARAAGVPLWSYQYDSQPRAAIGYSVALLLAALHRLGWVADPSDDLAEAVSVMRSWQEEIGVEQPVACNRAKALACQLVRRIPVVYAAEHLSAVARRWKGQFNENSKCWSVYDLFPELDHNTVVGFARPADMWDRALVVMLSSPAYHPRVALRIRITRELLETQGYRCVAVDAGGVSKLAQALSLVHLGDLVSYYLAILSGTDPWSIGGIEFVKSRLKASEWHRA